MSADKTNIYIDLVTTIGGRGDAFGNAGNVVNPEMFEGRQLNITISAVTLG